MSKEIKEILWEQIKANKYNYERAQFHIDQLEKVKERIISETKILSDQLQEIEDEILEKQQKPTKHLITASVFRRGNY